MPTDDLLPPSGDPVPAADAGRKRKPVDCEFCECSLTNAGEVLKFSDKAKRYRRHDELIAESEAKIAKLETELAAAKAKCAELAIVRETPRSGLEF